MNTISIDLQKYTDEQVVNLIMASSTYAKAIIDLPSHAIEMIAKDSSGMDIINLSITCKFFKGMVSQSQAMRERVEADLLQRSLRFEGGDETTRLRSFLEGASLTDNKSSYQAKIEKMHEMLSVYKSFFCDFNSSYEKYESTFFQLWPQDENFSSALLIIERCAEGIPHRNNALNVLKAIARLLNRYADMCRCGGKVDCEELHTIAVQGNEDGPGIGLAQKQTGKKFLALYSGPHITDEALSELGTSAWLCFISEKMRLVTDAGMADLIMGEVAKHGLSLAETIMDFSQSLQPKLNTLSEQNDSAETHRFTLS